MKSASGAAAFAPCVIIPVYNHGKAAYGVAAQTARLGCPVIMVDDGSDGETRAYLLAAAREIPGVVPVRRERNGGKGAALIDGLERARELGLTHALQIDADGQHDVSRAAFFLERAALNPRAVVCGLPVFGEDAPKGRLYGRKISTFWARAVTLSGAIADALCGFRVYPADVTLRLARAPFTDKRMGFDVEILARLSWRGLPIEFYPVRVGYPKDGVSHFRYIEDNIRISLVFTRLFLGMLARLPRLLARKIRGRG